MSTSIGFISGMLTGAALTLLIGRLRTGGWRPPQPGRFGYAGYGAILIGLFALSAAIIYLAIRTPGGQATMAGQAHPGAAENSGKAQPLEAATASLEARLNREGGTEQDWLLLAQSYDFMGRSTDADRARARAAALKGSGKGATPTPSMASVAAALDPAVSGKTPASVPPSESPVTGAPQLSIPELEARTRSQPRDPQNWLALAALQRSQHAYDRARAAYVKAIALHGMDAQAWADYADTLGSLAKGHIGADAGGAIRQALALDPNNAKALWLEASRQLQDHHYKEALADWQRLREALPADSPDVQLVDANIAEASQLAGVPLPQQQTRPAMVAGDSVQLSGTVSLDRRLADRVGPNSRLFIYAKSTDSPGPPLAVMRTAPEGWPVSFRLDDTMAMVPGRLLSQSKDVVVEARIAQQGQAQPSRGDLYVTSAVVHPADAQRLALIIDREVQ